MVLAQSDNQDRLLNAAITGANFKEGIESYLDIVDAFYSEDVEIIVGEDTEPVRGRGNLGARLYEFLANSRDWWFIDFNSIHSNTCSWRLRFELHLERPGRLFGRSNVDGGTAE
jgi:hypothetical protein